MKLISMRHLFWLVALLTGGIFWIPTYPPMIDLPQHAGQVSLLIDIFKGGVSRTNEFELNVLTPYWLGYGTWALLSSWMPLITSLKVLLSLTYFAFILSAVAIRKERGSDPRLDWLLLPAFFGFSFKFGFFTFLMAGPIVLLMLNLAFKHAKEPSKKSALIIIIGGIILFCSHALAFLYWLASSYLIIAMSKNNSIYMFYQKIKPIIILTALPPIYYIIFSENTINQQIISSKSIIWLYDSPRLLELFIYPYGSHGNSAIEMYMYILLILSPFFIGLRPSLSTPTVAPVIVFMIFWFTSPDYAMKTEFLYERFSLIFIPIYISLFKAHSKKSTTHPVVEINSFIIPTISTTLILSLCWQFINFEKEAHNFKSVISKIPNNGRLLSIIQDTNSPAAHNSNLYINYGSWYQAEKGGIADFNFAWFPPQPVRFKKETLPNISPKGSANMDKINWLKFDAQRYDYFLTRKTSDQPDLLIQHQCTKLIAQSGNWRAYSRISCL